MSSKITQQIEKAKAEGRKALVPYLPAGFPDKDAFWDAIQELDDSGADVIEIGIPFSDPVADGPVIEEAAMECLERGITLKWILDGLKQRAGQYKAALVLMGYLNPILQYGVEQFAKDAAAGGVNGCIIPDVPYEETDVLKPALEEQGIALIPLVGLNTPPSRMALYAENASGFVYLVSVMGVTGARASLPETIKDKMAEVRQAFDIPVGLGFGLKTPDQLEALGEGPDAVIFGSALITHMREGKSPKEFMQVWK